MKQTRFFALMLAVLISLSAFCLAETPDSSVQPAVPDETGASVPEDHVRMYRAVLNHQSAYIRDVDGGYAFLSDPSLQFDGEAVTYPEYAIADVDQDGYGEVILKQFLGGEAHEGYLVLDAADSKVYGYELVYRAMLDLKADGTFSFSSGASDNGFGYALMDGSFHVLPLVLSESAEYGVDYFKDGSRISESEFDAAFFAQNAKPDALWYAVKEGPLAVSAH